MTADELREQFAVLVRPSLQRRALAIQRLLPRVQERDRLEASPIDFVKSKKCPGRLDRAN